MTYPAAWKGLSALTSASGINLYTFLGTSEGNGAGFNVKAMLCSAGPSCEHGDVITQMVFL